MHKIVSKTLKQKVRKFTTFLTGIEGSVARCRGSWVVGRGRGCGCESWVWVLMSWGKKIKIKKSSSKKM